MFRIIFYFLLFSVNTYTYTYAILDFEVRHQHGSIIVQEMLESKSDDYMINKFMNEFSEKHVPEPKDGKDRHSILERLTIKKEVDRHNEHYCVYFFQNNHIELFSDNLEQNYQKKHNQHNWYAYHKIYVPKSINLDGCFEIFTHTYGSYFILSDKKYTEFNTNVNSFIKRYHLYQTIKEVDTSNYIPYYMTFIILISFFGINVYFGENKRTQLKKMMKILSWIRKRNEYPNNL